MAYASLLLGGRDSVAYAALGSLLLLGMNFWDHWLGIDLNVSFTHAGLNGMALFAVAILASNLAQRATSNQQLAEQRGIDLANETQLNRLILEQSHEGVIVIDAQHCIRHANPAAIRLLRLPHESNSESSRDSKFGRPPLARVNPDLNAALLAWRDAPDDALSETHVAYPMRLHARIRPLTDDPQGPVALFVEDDAYLREKLQQEKLAAMGRLTASIAHEIRNPLSAIGQAGQLLEESAQNAQDQQLLGIVRSQVARINQLVESVLTTAKRKQARPEVVHLAPWLHELIERYTSYTNLDGARIDLTVAPSLSARVDPRHLEQILVILLDNARQHGKPALGKQRIRIDVHTFGTENRPRIEVRDNGSGIAPEMRHRLFEPFFSTHAQGHGLGLFIARELAEANQLVLNYHHEVQGDRCFRLTFPRQELCHEVPPKKVEPKILEPAKQ
jgi:two-component system sensor histidine kinase PilS (NtrC family)